MKILGGKYISILITSILKVKRKMDKLVCILTKKNKKNKN